MEIIGYLGLMFIFLTILSLSSIFMDSSSRIRRDEKVLNASLIVLYLLMAFGIVRWLTL